jgi:hypothetical protein
VAFAVVQVEPPPEDPEPQPAPSKPKWADDDSGDEQPNVKAAASGAGAGAGPAAEKSKWLESDGEGGSPALEPRDEPPAPPKHRWEDDDLSPEACGHPSHVTFALPRCLLVGIGRYHLHWLTSTRPTPQAPSPERLKPSRPSPSRLAPLSPLTVPLSAPASVRIPNADGMHACPGGGGAGE